MRTVRAQVNAMMWHHTSDLTYNYRMEHAPWVQPRLAHDLPTPPHLAAFLAEEIKQYEPIEVSDGTTVVTLRPEIITWEMTKLDTGPYNYSVRVGWFRAGERIPHFGRHYDVNHEPTWLETHHAHVRAVEDAIPPSLDDKGMMPHHAHLKAGPIPHGHPLKHRESKPE